jgi:hypothetical protein
MARKTDNSSPDPITFIFAPNSGQGGLNFLLKAGNQFVVSGDQNLFGFDLSDDLNSLSRESRRQEVRDSDPPP